MKRIARERVILDVNSEGRAMFDYFNQKSLNRMLIILTSILFKVQNIHKVLGIVTVCIKTCGSFSSVHYLLYTGRQQIFTDD